MWRWSCPVGHHPRLKHVFSTYVEVILYRLLFCWCWLRILHVCGGDPVIHGIARSVKEYSPRMWRWSYFKNGWQLLHIVFSTYVEVILIHLIHLYLWFRILHVCGGDPEAKEEFYKKAKYSPRMWRWSCPWKSLIIHSFVFSTYVEVIPTGDLKSLYQAGILHVCGGDPRGIDY